MYPFPVNALEQQRAKRRLGAALEAQDWGAIMKSLTLFAARRGGRKISNDRAVDFAQEAIRRVLDPDYADWDPERETLLVHLGGIVNSLIWSHRQRASTRREIGDHDDAESADPTQSEDRLSARDTGRKLLSALRASFKEGSLELRVLALFAEGVAIAREQAESLELPIEAVYVARRKIDARVRDWARREEMGCEEEV
jgi:hypothetical protein